jgi:hypothetical protein
LVVWIRRYVGWMDVARSWDVAMDQGWYNDHER